MASLKKLASETIWYGLSNIAAKLLNQLLTPLITWLLHTSAQMADYGDFSTLYAYISFLNIVFTYGMETAFFRFSANGTEKNTLFQTAFTSILVSTALLSALCIVTAAPIAAWVGIPAHPEYIVWCVLIVAIDTLAAIPFARLRQEGKPRKYAFVRIMGILVNIFFTVFFLVYCPIYVANHTDGWLAGWYQHHNNTGYLIMANLLASGVTFLLLVGEWGSYRFKFNATLWKQMIAFAAPMIIIGMGGMVNETIDRPMLGKLFNGTLQEAKIAVAIYSANYKIAIFITLFITAFRMSAEPFFFKQSKEKNAPQTYARVMKWFVIILCFAFLFTGLFLDVWKYYIGPNFVSGIGVVPILLGANVCLGIYYNLSVWYKITNRMRAGIYITLMGAAITLAINFTFIPLFGMYACAWATLAAYASMVVACYLQGQKHFPVPYNVRKLLAYLGVMLVLFFTERLVTWLTPNVIVRLLAACVLLFLFLRLVIEAEHKELANMPVIGNWIKKKYPKLV